MMQQEDDGKFTKEMYQFILMPQNEFLKASANYNDQ